jgi:hypothetical protein
MSLYVLKTMNTLRIVWDPLARLNWSERGTGTIGKIQYKKNFYV